MLTAEVQTLALKAKLFRGFADPSRLAILEALRSTPLNVGEIVEATGLSQSNISNHLGCLRDCGLVVSVALTAASVHDSQVAIPLMKMSSARADYLYDLMDAAYDAGSIWEVSRSLGHVPIIDKNSRGKETLPMAPHEAARYKKRTAVERFNSRIKEEFGAGNVMVRGAQKVMMHLMFGVVALFADQLLKLAT